VCPWKLVRMVYKDGRIMFYIEADLCLWKLVLMVHKDGRIMFYIEADLSLGVGSLYGWFIKMEGLCSI
jgi:hypothetical protein